MSRATGIQAGAHAGPSGDWGLLGPSWRFPRTLFVWRLPGISLVHIMNHVGVQRANQEPGAHADPSKAGPPGKDKPQGFKQEPIWSQAAATEEIGKQGH